MREVDPALCGECCGRSPDLACQRASQAAEVAVRTIEILRRLGAIRRGVFDDDGMVLATGVRAMALPCRCEKR